MRNRWWALAWGTLFLLLPGCGSDHAQLVEESLQCWEEAADTIATIQDTASAEAARPKLQGILQRLQEQNERARKLDPLDVNELQELKAKSRIETSVILTRLNQETKRAMAIPGCANVVLEFNRQVQGLLR